MWVFLTFMARMLRFGRGRLRESRWPVSRGTAFRTLARVRAFDRLEQLYAIGGGPGANRIGYSSEEDAAHELARGWLEEAGLEVEVDDAGNMFGGTDPVWTGSHLDSVPQGGKFDGALGVVAAIEAVERAGRGTVAIFREEERGCVGLAGAVAARGRCRRRTSSCTSSRARGSPPPACRSGVVTAIVGYARGEVVVEGAAGHAGTTPMEHARRRARQGGARDPAHARRGGGDRRTRC